MSKKKSKKAVPAQVLSEALPVITLEDGVQIARELERWIQGFHHNEYGRGYWHVALGGGTLHRGRSTKDVDLVLFPRKAPMKRADSLRAHRFLQYVLRDILGWTKLRSAGNMRDKWKSEGAPDGKHVEVWRTRRDVRVDVIVMSK